MPLPAHVAVSNGPLVRQVCQTYDTQVGAHCFRLYMGLDEDAGGAVVEE